MSNAYFQFKKFRINQSQCAMKVSTDACIQGAWLANKIVGKTVLDIGTGTALLSLMIAQKNKNLQIVAIEINKEAAIQANENIANSPFAAQIKCINEDIKSYQPTHLYNCIVCNPPFFENDVLTTNAEKNLAKHSTALTLQQLLEAIKNCLQPNGVFCLLLPFFRKTACIKESKELGYYLQTALHIQHHQHKKPKNVVLLFTTKNVVPTEEVLHIKKLDDSYSTAMQALLQDYYLHL